MKFPNSEANQEWVFKMAFHATLAKDKTFLLDVDVLKRAFYKDFNPFAWNEVGHNSTHYFWARISNESNIAVEIKILNTITQGESVHTYTLEEADRLYLGHQ